MTNESIPAAMITDTVEVDVEQARTAIKEELAAISQTIKDLDSTGRFKNQIEDLHNRRRELEGKLVADPASDTVDESGEDAEMSPNVLKVYAGVALACRMSGEEVKAFKAMLSQKKLLTVRHVIEKLTKKVSDRFAFDRGVKF